MWWAACDSVGWIFLQVLSLLAIPLVWAAWADCRETRRLWPFIVAVFLAVAFATPPWIVYGDPAGNFGGLRTD